MSSVKGKATVKTQKVDLDELKNVLRHTIRNNEFLQNKGLDPVTINIVGNAGLNLK
jgi:hypothetical protein